MRFNRRIKIAPGVRVNVGLRRSSVTIGPRGASVNIGPSRTSGVRAQQRRERELARREQEQRRQEALAKIELKLLDNGSIEIIDAFGQPLGRRDSQFLWEQKGNHIREWLDDQIDKINGDVEMLTDIHLDTPAPDVEPEYTSKSFPAPPPEKPQSPILPTLGWVARLFKSRRIAQEVKVKEISNDYEVARALWKRRNEKWQQQKRNFETEQQERAQSFPQAIRTDVGLMEEHLGETLEALDWPRETLIDFDIREDGAAICLDVDLPEIEDIPDRIASLASTGKKLSIKKKPKTQLQLEYARHIHGIVFRLVGVCFAALPAAKTVVVSGYSQRLDKATGVVNDDYLLSVSVNRGEWRAIDFEALIDVDPVVALERFGLVRKMNKGGMFKAVEALAQ